MSTTAVLASPPGLVVVKYLGVCTCMKSSAKNFSQYDATSMTSFSSSISNHLGRRTTWTSKLLAFFSAKRKDVVGLPAAVGVAVANSEEWRSKLPAILWSLIAVFSQSFLAPRVSGMQKSVWILGRVAFRAGPGFQAPERSWRTL